MSKKRTKKNNFICIFEKEKQVIIEIKNPRIVFQIIPIRFYKILTSKSGHFTNNFLHSMVTNNCA